MTKPKMTDASNVQGRIQFSEQVLDSSAWIQKADELLAAAHLLEPAIQSSWDPSSIKSSEIVGGSHRANVQAPHFMLVAFALENLFKAVLVHANRPEFRNRLLSWLRDFNPPELRFLSHDLPDLAEKAGFKKLAGDDELLMRLYRNSEWAGRYPVPSAPDGKAARPLVKLGDKTHLLAMFDPEDVARLRDLVGRVRSFTEEKTREAVG